MSASSTVSHKDPVHTPDAPMTMAAAIWRPEPMPPAASTGNGATASITSGQHDRSHVAGMAPTLRTRPQPGGHHGAPHGGVDGAAGRVADYFEQIPLQPLRRALDLRIWIVPGSSGAACAASSRAL